MNRKNNNIIDVSYPTHGLQAGAQVHYNPSCHTWTVYFANGLMNTSTEELHILHDGIKVLIHDWQHSNEIDTELVEELQNPQNFSDYQDYIKHLLRLSKLETTIKALANFKN